MNRHAAAADKAAAPIHSVPPASLACRKRLTLTGSRGTKCLRRLMTSLAAAVAAGDWDAALQHTRTFAMCSETDSEDDDSDVDSAASAKSSWAAPAGELLLDASSWVMLRPSDVMSYGDFINMCTSCFHRLPEKGVGLPEPVVEPKSVRPSAKDLRQLLCDVETILLMCLASKIDLEPSEKMKLKNVVASIIFLLSWHPAMLEAISVIFLKLGNHTNNDCFCSFLSRWTFTTNAIQILFEVFCLLLIRQRRWLAFLLVLSASEHGSRFVRPLLDNVDVLNAVPEAGPVTGAHAGVIESLKIPCYAVSVFLHELIVGSASVPPGLDVEQIVLSILPMVIARPYSDEMLISRGWHYRLLLFAPPVRAFEPAQVLKLLRAQTRDVEENLLSELEFGARAVVCHAIPYYLLLANASFRSYAYEMLEARATPAYFVETAAPLRVGEADGASSTTDGLTNESAESEHLSVLTDHPVGHLPFERMYKNAMVKKGGYFLEDCVQLVVASAEAIPCARIILQHLSNEVLTAAHDLAALEEAGRTTVLPTDEDGLWWLRRGLIKRLGALHESADSGRRAYQVQELMSRLTERFFVNSAVSHGHISPFEEAVNSCNSHQRISVGSAILTEANGGGAAAHQPSYLQIVKRTMLEHTGCTLGRIDLCYLRLLENYETIYGRGSCLATVLLLCKKRRFEQGVLNVDNHVHFLLLVPYLANGIAGAYVKPKLAYMTGEDALRPAEVAGANARTASCAIANDVFPTLLPIHVAKLLPAWLAGRALQDPPRKVSSTNLIGWKLLGLELNVAASQLGQSGYGTGDCNYALETCDARQYGAVLESVCGAAARRPVAPHLDFLLLAILILLYAECGNPRAVHLIAKLSERMRLVEEVARKIAAKTGDSVPDVLARLQANRCGRLPFALPSSVSENLSTENCKLLFSSWILERGLISKFVLLGDIVFRFSELGSQELHEKVLLIFLSGEDLIRCRRVLRRCPPLKLKYARELEALKLKYQHMKSGRAARATHGAHEALMPSTTLNYNKDERLKESLAIVKRLAVMDDVDGAIDFFYKLRDSEGGLLDISVGNKILHLCVINGKLRKAEEILETLRNDAHCEINAIDFIPGSCVRPDVVTCNIIIKGMARERGGAARLAEIRDFILHMEKPFHLGGDGVKPDQVTFHAVINAAVNANDLAMTWELFNMMLERSIKIDSFTCNLVARQLLKGAHGASSCREDLQAMVAQFCAFVEQNDITNYDDNVSLLTSIIDMYAEKDTGRLKKFLDTVAAKLLARDPAKRGDAQELAALMVGYGKCGKVNKVHALWKQLEAALRESKWTTAILGSCIEAFAFVKDLSMVLALAERARKLIAQAPSMRPLTATQYSAIIRTCVVHQKQADALAVYEAMKQYELQPNEAAYNALIHSCVQAGSLNTALAILNEMGHAAPAGDAAAVRPDIVTYSTIIKGLCDEGDMEAALELFESLPAKGLVRDSVTYNTVLEGFARAGDGEALERVFGEMMSCLDAGAAAAARPTCYTLTILVKFYGRRRQVDHVINLVKVLPTLGKFKLDSYVYTAVIAACAWNNRVAEAYNYLLLMRQYFGCGSRTYGTLLSGCLKCRNCRVLRNTLALVLQDKVRLDKREVTALRDLLKQYTARTLNPLWLQYGFTSDVADLLKQVLALQRREAGAKPAAA